MPLQKLRPAVQDDEAGGVGLRLNQHAQGVNEGLSGGAGGQRGRGLPEPLVRGGEDAPGGAQASCSQTRLLPYGGPWPPTIRPGRRSITTSPAGTAPESSPSCATNSEADTHWGFLSEVGPSQPRSVGLYSGGGEVVENR